MTFVINTIELSRSPGAERDFQIDVPAPADFQVGVLQVPEGSPIKVKVLLESVIEGIFVSGEVTANFVGECSRCLSEIAFTTEESFAELYVYEQQDDELALAGESLDLEPVIRDTLLAGIPINPLCKPDCLGLCVECGANLNDEPNHHHDAPIDPRWSGLESLGGDDES